MRNVFEKFSGPNPLNLPGSATDSEQATGAPIHTLIGFLHVAYTNKPYSPGRIRDPVLPISAISQKHHL